ncbi:MBL fold metallo-hydrolase [Methanocella sp. MCL-LM]|uniref:MBL fold metallo-hydrolase n=1 Tax=Methanocella sp. MCL-LM TaxID=3412035 RepID=UPI003C75B9F7
MVDSVSAWLKVSELSKDTWRIEDAGMVSQYLLAGKEKALLIDAGWGIGDLHARVASLTSLPLTVINTHGHPDHTCGNYRFENVRIHQADVPLLKKNFSPKVRHDIMQRFKDQPLPEGFSEDAWVHAPLKRFAPFSGELSFDLGGRVVDVIETPGHTPGSVSLYDRKEKWLFTADNIMEGNTLLNLEGSMPLSIFMNSVNKLAAMENKVEALYPAHGRVALKPSTLSDMQKGVKKVLDGKLIGKPEKTSRGSGAVIRFDSCGIVYNDERRY